LLIPPFYTAGGDEIRVGQNVFVNQNCTFYDLGGLDIADDVMIGPSVSMSARSKLELRIVPLPEFLGTWGDLSLAEPTLR
jgi:acetyltransferase-like isoleucine patch superfamily enzyme